MTRKLAVVVVTFVLASGVALASWYDDYDAGLAAAKKGQWQVVVQKMSAAIKGNAKEADNARTYGANFINYHPYYYRGVANLNLGNYDAAISDFEKTSGPGDTNLGALETLMSRAKTKLAEASEPAPAPAPQPAPVQPAVQPQPRPVAPAPQPAAPSIDPGLRSQVSTAINAADASVTRNKKASASPQYQQAVAALIDARSKFGAAKSNDDLNAALASANNAKTLADIATPPSVATSTAPPAPSRVNAATQLTIGDLQQRVRRALDAYFNGDFEVASAQFKRLADNELRNNGWIYAFLGASQYSQYAFEADESYKEQAIQSFKKAKQLRFKKGLPERYFSKRIRKAFNDVAG